jgi:glutathionylspermidine amidase/synthetase
MELKAIPMSGKNINNVLDMEKTINQLIVRCENIDKYIDNMTEFRYLLVKKEKDDYIKKSTEELHRMFFEGMEYVLKPENEEYLRAFGIDEIFWEEIRESLKSTPPEDFLYSRFDCGVSSEDGMKVFELNTGCNGYLYYTANVQDAIYNSMVNEREGVSSGYKLDSMLVKKWKKIVSKYVSKSKCVYFIIDDDDDERILALHFTEILRSLGYTTRVSYKDELLYIGHDNKLYDKDTNAEVELIHSTFQWNTIFTYKTSQDVPKFVDILLNPNVQVLEPKWVTVMGNKAMLAIVWKLFPNHHLLLPTTFYPNEQVFNKDNELLEKHIKGRGSFQVKVIQRDENGCFIQNAECIYQKKFEGHKVNGRFYIVAPWLIGDEYGGFLVKETQNLINDWDTDMVSTRIV